MEERASPEPAQRTLHLPAAEPNSVSQAAQVLQRGGLVAMPTETVYGLAANALDEAAVAKIFLAKQRPAWDPLIVHVAHTAMLHTIVREVSPRAQLLMEAFWPGPLTLLLPRHPLLPLPVTAGRDLVGVRLPAHPVAQVLIRAAGVPLAAPSANRFGHISPTTAAHVLADLDGRIDAVLDAGPCGIGVESTVLDPAAMVLYRQGGISAAQVEAVVQQGVHVYQPATRQESSPESLPSPGVGIRHYAPRARVVLVDDEAALRAAWERHAPRLTGVLLPADWAAPPAAEHVLRWAKLTDADELARTLYDRLRVLDAIPVTTILCPLPPEQDGTLMAAVRDRLMKAAREA